jgi:hypothetical protein
MPGGYGGTCNCMQKGQDPIIPSAGFVSMRSVQSSPSTESIKQNTWLSNTVSHFASARATLMTRQRIHTLQMCTHVKRSSWTWLNNNSPSTGDRRQCTKLQHIGTAAVSLSSSELSWTRNDTHQDPITYLT